VRLASYRERFRSAGCGVDGDKACGPCLNETGQSGLDDSVAGVDLLSKAAVDERALLTSLLTNSPLTDSLPAGVDSRRDGAMAMGRHKPRQRDLMISWSDLPRSPGHAFY
jgi:hypothetical protein